MTIQRKHNKQIVGTARMLRKNMTKEEKHLWYDYLRLHPARFSRQKILGKYIVDFYSAKLKLVIELDGSQHFTEEAIRYDNERTEFLKNYDLKVIRIPNWEINQNFDGVCEYLNEILSDSAEGVE